MSAGHTPTPWEVVPATEYHGAYVVSEFGITIADLYAMSNFRAASVRNGGDSYPVPFDNSGANAAFIVLAVNSHDELVAALADINRVLSETRAMPSHLVGNEIEWCIDHARAALAKAAPVTA